MVNKWGTLTLRPPGSQPDGQIHPVVVLVRVEGGMGKRHRDSVPPAGFWIPAQGRE